MKQQHTLVKTLPISIIVAFIATRWVHGRYFDETFVCDTGERCDLGSSMSWLLTGISAVGPFIALAGFFWSRHLHHQNRLGPFSSRAIPDTEQILEVLFVIGAMLATYWLMLNGPSIEFVEPTRDLTLDDRPNQLAQWLRDFRAPDILDADAREKLEQVPSRRTWFLIGIILGGPFAYSLGTMLGREWYGRKRRKAQEEAGDAGDDASDQIDLTGLGGRSTPDIDLTAESKLNDL